jgi:hypothetical protein
MLFHGVRASSRKHAVQHRGIRRCFGALARIAARTQPRTDEPLVATQRGLDQRALVVAGHLLPTERCQSDNACASGSGAHKRFGGRAVLAVFAASLGCRAAHPAAATAFPL